jgi:hypothetical protein
VAIVIRRKFATVTFATTRPLSRMAKASRGVWWVCLVVAWVAGCGGGGGDPDARNDPSPDSPPAIDAEAGDPTTITFTVVTGDGAAETGSVVLVSDDGGAWQPVVGVAGVYTVEVIGPRYAIARGCRNPEQGYAEAFLYYLTVDDATELKDIGCHDGPDADVSTISGAVSGIDALHRGRIAGNHDGAVLGTGASSYAVRNVRGPTDLVVARFTSAAPRYVDRMLIVRDLDATTDVVRDLDLEADGFDPVEHELTVAGAGSGDFERASVLLRRPGLQPRTIESSVNAPGLYHAPPAAEMRPGELLTINRYTSTAGSARSVAVTLAAPADATGTLPPAYTATAPTVVATTPGVRLAGTLPLVDGADRYDSAVLHVDTATSQTVYWWQSYTARWADDAAIAYEYPDLVGIGGWDVALPPTALTWESAVLSSSLTDGLPDRFVPVPAGDVTTLASTSGALDVP